MAPSLSVVEVLQHQRVIQVRSDHSVACLASQGDVGQGLESEDVFVPLASIAGDAEMGKDVNQELLWQWRHGGVILLCCRVGCVCSMLEASREMAAAPRKKVVLQWLFLSFDKYAWGRHLPLEESEGGSGDSQMSWDPLLHLTLSVP